MQPWERASLPLGRRGAMSLTAVVLAAALVCRLLSWDFHEVEKQPGRGLALSPLPLLPRGMGSIMAKEALAPRQGKCPWAQARGAAASHGDAAGPQGSRPLGSGGAMAVPCEACG